MPLSKMPSFFMYLYPNPFYSLSKSMPEFRQEVFFTPEAPKVGNFKNYFHLEGVTLAQVCFYKKCSELYAITENALIFCVSLPKPILFAVKVNARIFPKRFFTPEIVSSEVNCEVKWSYPASDLVKIEKSLLFLAPWCMPKFHFLNGFELKLQCLVVCFEVSLIHISYKKRFQETFWARFD